MEAFVTRFYQQCLGRNPDQPGLDSWVDNLLNGSQSGSDVAYGFVFSDEFVNRNTTNEDFVTILYRAFFDRDPDAAGYSAWIGNLYGGTGRSDVLNGFVSSREFENLCQRYGIAPYAIDPPSIVFNYPPVDRAKVAYILPMGAMTGSHVTPVDHQYYISNSSVSGSGEIDVDVYSPGNGTVISIQHMQQAAGDPPLPVDDFRLEIRHTATVSSISFVFTLCYFCPHPFHPMPGALEHASAGGQDRF